MRWQDIIFTPLFWIMSGVGSVLLSVIANLLTPQISAFVTRHFHARKSALREKQIKRRHQVIMLQENMIRRTSTKLDAIFMVILSLLLLLLGLFIVVLSSVQSVPTNKSSLVSALCVLLTVIGSIVSMVSGLKAMSLALMADRRERAIDDFQHGRGSDSTDAARQFLDEWDLHEFGVASQDIISR
jgi:hypothetical protein